MENRAVREAATCAIKFIDVYTGRYSKTKRYKALKALAELTLLDINENKVDSGYSYTTNDLVAKMKTKTTLIEESEKKSANQYLKDLAKHLPSHREMLIDIAKENKLSFIPSYNFYDNTGGGSGNYSTHSIIPLEIEYNETPSEIKHLSKDEVKYYLESIDNLPFYIKWLNNFELSGWRIKLIAALFFATLIFAVFLSLIFFVIYLNPASNGPVIIKNFLNTLFIGALSLWPSKLIYFCLTNRIISAPTLLMPSDLTNAQIECFATDKINEKTGKRIRKLRIVSYAAKCPLCEERIEVEDGGKEFNNRLIGRCQESPLEHVYSFDRVLKVGRKLRIN